MSIVLKQSRSIFFGIRFFVLFFLMPRKILGEMIYKDRDGVAKNVPLFSLLNWNYHLNVRNVPLVDIQHDRKIFDYCDTTMYTRKGILPLLAVYNIQHNGTWIAVIPEFTNIGGRCGSISLEERYMFNTMVCMSYYIQKLGAEGYIHTVLDGMKIINPKYPNDEIYPKRECVDYNNFSINNMKINIFGAVISATDIDYLILSLYIKNETKYIIANISDTLNPFDNYFAPFSYTMLICSWIAGLFSVYCFVMDGLLIYRIGLAYLCGAGNHHIFLSIALFHLLIANFLRILAFIDIGGVCLYSLYI